MYQLSYPNYVMQQTEYFALHFKLWHWTERKLEINHKILRSPSDVTGQDAVHITAILGESVIFNCHVEFPGDHPVPYVLQWEKKVSETVW